MAVHCVCVKLFLIICSIFLAVVIAYGENIVRKSSKVHKYNQARHGGIYIW